MNSKVKARLKASVAQGLAIFLATVLSGCVMTPWPNRPPGSLADADLSVQKAEVEAVQRPLRAERRVREDALEHDARAMTADERQLKFDELTIDFEERERAVLERLAERGNSEAIYQLSSRLRDAAEPDEVRRWFDLVNRAAELRHPAAELDLNRWYWHQRDNGSIQDVQRNRAIALDYAERAASGGELFGIQRVAVYIAGDVHQYPQNRELARRLLELCARANDEGCQEILVSLSPYDYGLSPTTSYFWLYRLAARRPDRFLSARDAMFSRLSDDEKVSVTRLAAAWTPTEWRSLEREWKAIRQEIMAHGERSVGADTACSTATPWCRGKLLLEDRSAQTTN